MRYNHLLTVIGVALMAVGCWGIHLDLDTRGWLGLASVAGILVGGIMTFLANIPTLSEERSTMSD